MHSTVPLQQSQLLEYRHAPQICVKNLSRAHRRFSARLVLHRTLRHNPPQRIFMIGEADCIMRKWEPGTSLVDLENTGIMVNCFWGCAWPSLGGTVIDVLEELQLVVERVDELTAVLRSKEPGTFVGALNWLVDCDGVVVVSCGNGMG